MIILISQFKLLQVATRWFVDVAQKLRKHYSNISQICGSGDLAISLAAAYSAASVFIVPPQLLLSVC